MGSCSRLSAPVRQVLPLQGVRPPRRLEALARPSSRRQRRGRRDERKTSFPRRTRNSRRIKSKKKPSFRSVVASRFQLLPICPRKKITDLCVGVVNFQDRIVIGQVTDSDLPMLTFVIFISAQSAFP